MSTELNPFGASMQPQLVLVADNQRDAQVRFGQLGNQHFTLLQNDYHPAALEGFKNVTILLPNDLELRPQVARDLRRLIYDPSNRIIKV